MRNISTIKLVKAIIGVSIVAFITSWLATFAGSLMSSKSDAGVIGGFLVFVLMIAGFAAVINKFVIRNKSITHNKNDRRNKDA